MNILLIEDDEVWQQQLYVMLEEFIDTKIDLASTLEEARYKLANHTPDLIIADIILADGLVFQLFSDPIRTYPIVFMTSHASHQLLDNALQLPKTAFMVKPFHALTLIGAIRSLTKTETIATNTENKLEVLGKYKQAISILYDNILYVEADGNYMKIYTADKVYSYKSSLKELLAVLDKRFLQIHKSFIINTHFVNRVDLTAGVVVVKRNELPIGRAYRRLTIDRLSQTM